MFINHEARIESIVNRFVSARRIGHKPSWRWYPITEEERSIIVSELGSYGIFSHVFNNIQERVRSACIEEQHGWEVDVS